MKKSFLLLSCAAALTMASCSQEKTTDTTTTTTTMGAADGTAMNANDMDGQYRSRAATIATKMASDMKIEDTATVSRVRMAYYNRSRRMGELRNQYTADTTGMAAAMRDANMQTDTEFKSIFTEPTQYQAYESSRSTYDESNYMDDNSAMSSGSDMNAASSDMNSSSMDNSTDMAAGTDASGTTQVTKLKAKAEDGSKLKVKDNGKMKTKDAEGNKTKTE
ncbi:hypothetical protein [Hymenobacter elongatus]|uniref:Lipoprotein n=1 Tax=Hymenobacter elongatus TaxID=877208 RepID=A0A4Z0PGQ3_9BACT|nr:hypothetical protein [Hymenobacter elongatus]TGE14354.1 hypothetical protein E5J99_16630 [Hymenobacter elongatus]